MYRRWKRLLSPETELIPLELSGRGTRIKDPLYIDFNEAIQDLADRIDTDSEDYMIFGHSFGGLLALGAGGIIDNAELKPPARIFISGTALPHLYNKREPLSHLPDNIFLKKVSSIGGTPPGFTEEPELCNLLLPVLRNDFRLIEENNFPYPPVPVSSPLTIIRGDRDNFAEGDIFEWNNYTEEDVSVHMFQGDHFFINSSADKITGLINSTA